MSSFPTVREVTERVDEARYEETLRKLVSIPSLSGEERELANWIGRRLKEVGVLDVEVDEYDNVVARFGSGRQHLLISAHTDTMAPHSSMEEPFTPAIREENSERRLYGLGAATAKACLASIIECITVLIDCEVEIPKITFVGVACDLHPERHGIKDAFRKHAFQADAVLVGEPTNGKIGIGARGYAHVKLTFRGQPHHAGRPNNLKNPIAGASAFIQRVLAEPLPEHPQLGSASVAPIEILSKGQRPQTPQSASVMIDRRLVPTDPPVDDLLAQFREMAESYSEALSVELELERHQYPWVVDQGEAIVAALAEGYQIAARREPEFYSLPFSSSSGFIKQTRGIMPVAFSGGDIAKMGPDEYTVLSQNIVATKAMVGAALLFTST